MQYQGRLVRALVVIAIAVPACSGFPPVVLVTDAVRATLALSSSAVTRISSVCPLVAVTVLLSIVVRVALLTPLDAAANAALMPSKMTGLEATCMSGGPPSCVLLVKV